MNDVSYDGKTATDLRFDHGGVRRPAGGRDSACASTAVWTDLDERLLGASSLGMYDPRSLTEQQIKEVCLAFHAEQMLRKCCQLQSCTAKIVKPDPSWTAPVRPALPTRAGWIWWALVANDFALDRARSREMLESLGFEVDCVEDGAAALKVIQAGFYDLVVLNIRMSMLDGIETTKLVRALQGPQRRVPILALLPNASMQEVDACLAAGMDEVMVEPFGIAMSNSLIRWLAWRGIRPMTSQGVS